MKDYIVTIVYSVSVRADGAKGAAEVAATNLLQHLNAEGEVAATVTSNTQPPTVLLTTASP